MEDLIGNVLSTFLAFSILYGIKLLVDYSRNKKSKNDKKEKVICPHCNCKNNPKRKYCYMCGKNLQIIENEINTENKE